MTDAIEAVAERVFERDEPMVVKPAKADDKTKQKSMNLKPRDDGEWDLPSLDLLQTPPPEKPGDQLDEQSLQRNAIMLQQVLEDFSIQGEIVKIHPGPVVTLYELEPAPGTKSSRVIGLSEDIARSMSAISVRCAVVPATNK